MSFITTTVWFCLLSFVHPKPLMQLTQRGGTPAWNVTFLFFVPFLPLVGPWVLTHCSLSLRLNRHSAQLPA